MKTWQHLHDYLSCTWENKGKVRLDNFVFIPLHSLKYPSICCILTEQVLWYICRTAGQVVVAMLSQVSDWGYANTPIYLFMVTEEPCHAPLTPVTCQLSHSGNFANADRLQSTQDPGPWADRISLLLLPVADAVCKLCGCGKWICWHHQPCPCYLSIAYWYYIFIWSCV